MYLKIQSILAIDDATNYKTILFCKIIECINAKKNHFMF